MRLLLHNIQYGTGRLKRFSWLTTLHHTTNHMHKIMRLVKAVNPDIVALIEVDSGSYRSRKENQAEYLAKKLNYNLAHRVKYSKTSVGRKIPVLNKQSNAVLAKQEICKQRFYDFTSGFKSLVIEVELPELTIFVVHLSLGMQSRHRQLDELHRLFETCKKPKILAGDFNTLSGEWEIGTFLKAAGLQSCNQQHIATFPAWAPQRELDFICYDERIIPKRFRIPKISISDHLPLIFDFEIKPQ